MPSAPVWGTRSIFWDRISLKDIGYDNKVIALHRKLSSKTLGSGGVISINVGDEENNIVEGGWITPRERWWDGWVGNIDRGAVPYLEGGTSERKPY